MLYEEINAGTLESFVAKIRAAETGEHGVIPGLTESDMTVIRQALPLPLIGQVVDVQTKVNRPAKLYRVPFEPTTLKNQMALTNESDRAIPTESYILVAIGPGDRDHGAHCTLTEMNDKTQTLVSVICSGERDPEEIDIDEAVEIVNDSQVETWLDNLEYEIVIANKAGMFGHSRQAVIPMLSPEARQRHTSRIRGLAADLELISLRVLESGPVN